VTALARSRLCETWLGAFSSIWCRVLLGIRGAGEDTGGCVLHPWHVRSAPQIRCEGKELGRGGCADAGVLEGALDAVRCVEQLNGTWQKACLGLWH